MAKKGSSLSIVLSALFSTLLLCVLSLLASNKFTIWDKIGTGEKFWTIFALVYAIVLTLSGWLYAVSKLRVVGLIHATLMLAIAGLVIYGIFRGMVTNPGVDNAAAGILAAANFVFVAIGILSASCGLAIFFRLFPAKETSMLSENPSSNNRA
jgi:hypothetical protein